MLERTFWQEWKRYTRLQHFLNEAVLLAFHSALSALSVSLTLSEADYAVLLFSVWWFPLAYITDTPRMHVASVKDCPRQS